jgi:hypothetical protein
MGQIQAESVGFIEADCESYITDLSELSEIDGVCQSGAKSAKCRSGRKGRGFD